MIGRTVVPGHTDWCARDHRCGLGHHRAEEIVMRVGTAHGILTRVQGRDGRQWAEITLSLPISSVSSVARLQLLTSLRCLRATARRVLTAGRCSGA